MTRNFRAVSTRPASTRPTLRVERSLLRSGHTLVGGMDEVGRGALAGPVTVGVVVVDASTRSAPPGLRDSKLLTPHAREALAPRVRRWAPAFAVASSTAAEVDRYGIIAALRLAGTRALSSLPVLPGLVVLDGNHDWLTPPAPALFEDDELTGRTPPPLPELQGPAPAVQTMVKADLRCSAVAAASVLAKTSRDAVMVALADEHPEFAVFGWASNKGYSAAEHLEALRRHGPSRLHRRSWRLPGTWDVHPDGDDAEPAAVQPGISDGAPAGEWAQVEPGRSECEVSGASRVGETAQHAM
ncbi:MAG: ribonuclease HII [Actinomycetales bacterium]